MEKFVRGLVRFVFIACYVAFMLASIRHVATFFNGFEPNKDNTIGSYLLAGAFDITALVTTIGVMFFRKSMPRWVFVIVWAFIIAIAGYSYIINLEYTSHYQDMSMLMQPTGATTPVFDASGNVQYVPAMQVNTTLMYINPFLASGFTVFALIYSVIAEFFGTKPPSTDELKAQKQYLEETVGLQQEIDALKARAKKPSLIERGKERVKEVVKAGQEIAQEVRKQHDTEPLNSQQHARTEEHENVFEDGYDTGEREALSVSLNTVSESAYHPINHTLGESLEELAKHYPMIASWRSLRTVSVPLKEVIKVTGKHHKTVSSAVGKGLLEGPKAHPDRVFITSVVKWLLSELSEQSRVALEETIEVSVVDADKTSAITQLNDALPRLGMIEQRMLDAVLDAPASERRKLQEYADDHSLAETTIYLKQRYAQYADFIIERRVADVMKVYQAQHRETVVFSLS